MSLRRTMTLVPLLLALALAACGSGGVPGAAGSSAAGSAASRPASGGWTVVAQANGDADHQTTAPFALTGKEVRFVYTVQPNSTGPVPLLWNMRPEGEPVTTQARASQSCVECDGEQTNDLHVVPAGRYYVQVITSRPWTLKVEERS
jgi:hypothetical protein